MEKDTFDIVVIGAGPGGYVAAIRASQLGLKTAIIEGNHLGGICLNWGCIPTKALLRSAEIFHYMNNAKDYGLSVKDASLDLEKVVARSREVAKTLSSGIGKLLRKHKIPVFEGFGMLNGRSCVKIEKDGQKIAELEAKNIILSTGARARELPHIKPDGKRIFTYKEAMTPKEKPTSLLVIGSGAIGVEFASFYRSIGVDVTIVEIAPHILPAEDEEVSKFAQKQFEAQGIQIKTHTNVISAKNEGKKVSVVLESKDKKTHSQHYSHVISAVGIVANTESLGLDGTNIAYDRGFIKTDEWMETDEKHVYAIGDVTAAPWLAHKASHEAIICVEKIAGVDSVKPIDKTKIPGCTYSNPQIASIGLKEADAKAKKIDVKIGRFPYMGNGKAIALGETEGFVKTIWCAKTGALLGAHLIGAEVTELIHSFALAMTLEATEEDFMHTIFPHPTLSEMIHESTLNAFDRAIHI